jgi:hypothetical protein
MRRHTVKFFCLACDHVAQDWPAHGEERFCPRCPTCMEPMKDVGSRWRPGRKGRRGSSDARIARRAAQKQGRHFGRRFRYHQRPSF